MKKLIPRWRSDPRQFVASVNASLAYREKDGEQEILLATNDLRRLVNIANGTEKIPGGRPPKTWKSKSVVEANVDEARRKLAEEKVRAKAERRPMSSATVKAIQADLAEENKWSISHAIDQLRRKDRRSRHKRKLAR